MHPDIPRFEFDRWYFGVAFLTDEPNERKPLTTDRSESFHIRVRNDPEKGLQMDLSGITLTITEPADTRWLCVCAHVGGRAEPLPIFWMGLDRDAWHPGDVIHVERTMPLDA